MESGYEQKLSCVLLSLHRMFVWWLDAALSNFTYRMKVRWSATRGRPTMGRFNCDGQELRVSIVLSFR
jgi:hypothetical protein